MKNTDEVAESIKWFVIGMLIPFMLITLYELNSIDKKINFIQKTVCLDKSENKK